MSETPTSFMRAFLGLNPNATQGQAEKAGVARGHKRSSVISAFWRLRQKALKAPPTPPPVVVVPPPTAAIQAVPVAVTPVSPDPREDPEGALVQIYNDLRAHRVDSQSAGNLIKITTIFLERKSTEMQNKVPTPGAFTEGLGALVAFTYKWAHDYTAEQMTVIRAFSTGSVILRTPRGVLGKTTIATDTLAFLLLSRVRRNIHLFCGKERTAGKILKKILGHLLRNGVTKKDLTHASNSEITFQDGTTITAHANTIADINSARGDLLVFEEANLIPRAIFETSMPLLVGQTTPPHAWFIGNALEDVGDAFNEVCNLVFKLLNGLPVDDSDVFRVKKFMDVTKAQFFQFERDVNSWVSQEDQEALDALLTLFGGDDAVTAQMTNTLVGREGALYSQDQLAGAFTAKHPDPEGLAHECTVRVLAIDWGTVHDSSFLLLGIKNGMIEELAHWVGSVAQETDAQWKGVLSDWDTRFMPTVVLTELSPNAKAYMNPWVFAHFGGRCIGVMFEQGNYGKGECLGAVQTLMSQARFRLRSRVLEKQCRSLTYQDLTKKYQADDAHDTLLYASRLLLLHHADLLGIPLQPSVPLTSLS